MRCPNCNRFVSHEAEGDPEVELDATLSAVPDAAAPCGQVLHLALSGNITVTLDCAECGSPLMEARLDLDLEETLPWPEGLRLNADLSGVEVHDDLSRTDETRRERGRKVRFYGVNGTLEVRLGTWRHTLPYCEEVTSGEMDEA